MNCTEARQHAMLFLDSEGDPELHLRIRDHLGDCPDCSKWFTGQRQIEQKINEFVSAGSLTPQLWQRVLSHAKASPALRRKRRWMLLTASLAAAAVMIALAVAYQIRHYSSYSNELSHNAAAWHEQWQRGNLHPDMESNSDLEVDRYLKTRVPFRVHCPPRTDVQFSVQGAGVCFMKDRRQAAYIVGSVGKSPVSILVLDRADVEGFPQARFYHRQEGLYQVASGVIDENVVIVTGTTSLEVLDRLLNAYGTYPDS